MATWHRVVHKDIDPKHLIPYLGFRPLDIIKRTLDVTTQLAKMVIRYPLRYHNDAYELHAPIQSHFYGFYICQL